MVLVLILRQLVRLLLLVVLNDAGQAWTSPSINVAVQASFASPPYLLELL